MKVLPINYNTNIKQNIKFEGTNTTTKTGIAALIVGTSLFMMSNAIDSFEKQPTVKQNIGLFAFFDTIASIASIVGTLSCLIGLKQDEENEENSRKNQHR